MKSSLYLFILCVLYTKHFCHSLLCIKAEMRKWLYTLCSIEVLIWKLYTGVVGKVAALQGGYFTSVPEVISVLTRKETIGFIFWWIYRLQQLLGKMIPDTALSQKTMKWCREGLFWTVISVFMWKAGFLLPRPPTLLYKSIA